MAKLVLSPELDRARMVERLLMIDAFMRKCTAGDAHSLETLVALAAVWKGVKLRQVDPDCVRMMEEASDELAKVYLEYLKEHS